MKKHPATKTSYDLIIFCHLRWEFVFQRPQHIITRLSEDFKILIIEEPIPYEEGEKNSARIVQVNPNLTVLQPAVDTISEITSVLENYNIDPTTNICWFYSASFLPLLLYFKYDKIVYDCMDELSLFKGAPPELVALEEKLISIADVVFTGGKSLFESKREFNKETYCFPSSVDRTHFETGTYTIIPEDISKLPKPIIGYYGVIDERIDYTLLEQIATANPEYSFVMIGPLAKVTEDDLPKLQNLHFLGGRSYKELPAYLAAFDIAMMPFALNDSTKYISPTKTLEYMAGGKPIISTPIRDVVRDYSESVKIINTAEEFTEDIKEIMNSDKAYLNKYETILDATSWDNTARQMKELIINIEVE